MYCVQSPNSVLIAIGELNEPDTKVLILQLIDVSMVVKLPSEKKQTPTTITTSKAGTVITREATVLQLSF